MNENAVSSLVAAARSDAARLAAEGRWTEADSAELGRVFERSAARALRTPRLAERSLVLRRFARRIVPARARPHLRRALAFVERPLGVVSARRGR
ncbi:MAG: hypothetical protein ABSA31_00085 [Acidimicrobiales bacterium]